MNCIIAAEDSEQTFQITRCLEKFDSHFRINHTIELIKESAIPHVSACDVVFFPPEKTIFPAIENLLAEIPCPIPVLFIDSNDKRIPLIDASALEKIIIPLRVSNVLQFENRVKDLKALHERNESFVLGWRNALNFFYGQLDVLDSDCIVLPDINGYREMNCGELLKIEDNGPYATAYLLNGDCITLCKPLGHFEKVLNSSQFFRLNNDYIVNGTCVIDWKLQSPAKAIINDGTIIPISPRRLPLLIDQIQKLGNSGTSKGHEKN